LGCSRSTKFAATNRRNYVRTSEQEIGLQKVRIRSIKGEIYAVSGCEQKPSNRLTIHYHFIELHHYYNIRK
jgi:hypothetical protein